MPIQTPEQVGQSAERHDQRGQGQQVGDGHPFDTGDRCAKDLFEGRQHQPGDAGVELAKKRADANRDDKTRTKGKDRGDKRGRSDTRRRGESKSDIPEAGSKKRKKEPRKHQTERARGRSRGESQEGPQREEKRRMDSGTMSKALGGLTIAVGVLSFVQTKNAQTLIGPLLVGGGLWAGGRYINKGERLKGHTIAAVSSLGLVAEGLSRNSAITATATGVQPRYSSAGTIAIPPGPIVLIGGISAAYQAKKAYDWK